MNKYSGFESDWKLFSGKYTIWNENYIDKLCEEYMEILSSDSTPSERFCNLSERIKDDRSKVVMAVRNSRGEMIRNIVDLINRGVITMYDLDEFSNELRETVKSLIEQENIIWD